MNRETLRRSCHDSIHQASRAPRPQPGVIPGLVRGSLLALSLPPLQAQETLDGLFITVPNPIDDKAVNQIERKVQEAGIERQKRNITIIVFNFNPLEQL